MILSLVGVHFSEERHPPKPILYSVSWNTRYTFSLKKNKKRAFGCPKNKKPRRSLIEKNRKPKNTNWDQNLTQKSSQNPIFVVSNTLKAFGGAENISPARIHIYIYLYIYIYICCKKWIWSFFGASEGECHEVRAKNAFFGALSGNAAFGGVILGPPLPTVLFRM